MGFLVFWPPKMGQEPKKERGVGRGRKDTSHPHLPLSFFGSCPILPPDKTLFLGLSFLPKPWEMLAIQATFH